MHLQILKDIAKELDGMDVSDATLTESNIADILINAGLLQINNCNAKATGSRREIDWEEYQAK